MATLVHYYGLGKDEKLMTFIYYLFIIASILYLIIAIPGMYLCLGCISANFILEFIVPKISTKRYKKNAVIILNKENTKYHVTLSYQKQYYHFYNRELYNVVDIGDMFYVHLFKKHSRLYLKIPYSKGRKHHIIKSKKLS